MFLRLCYAVRKWRTLSAWKGSGLDGNLPTPHDMRGTSMKAFVFPAFDTQPTVADLPTPEPGPGEVLVRARAASVNGIDLSIASGRLQGMLAYDFPVVLGKDFAGTVEAVGSSVIDFAVGDRVFGVVSD